MSGLPGCSASLKYTTSVNNLYYLHVNIFRNIYFQKTTSRRQSLPNIANLLKIGNVYQRGFYECCFKFCILHVDLIKIGHSGFFKGNLKPYTGKVFIGKIPARRRVQASVRRSLQTTYRRLRSLTAQV